jgi:hypothetical protein
MRLISFRQSAVTLVLLTFALLLGLAAPPVAAQKALETFSGNIVSTGVGGSMVRVQIGINRWTTDEERNELAPLVTSGATDALRSALQEQEFTGFVRIAGNTFQLRYAREFVQEDGTRQIIIASDREIGGAELYSSVVTKDFSLSIAALDLNKKGRGEGVVARAAKLVVDESGRIKVDTYGDQMFKVHNIRKTK